MSIKVLRYVLAGLLACAALFFLLVSSGLLVGAFFSDGTGSTELVQRPVIKEVRIDTVAALRDNDAWRDLYNNFEGTPLEFAGEDGKNYKVPSYDSYGPYSNAVNEQTNYGERIVNLPGDGNKLHLTIIYKDRRKDGVSQHVANMFTMKGHWLNKLLANAHYRKLYEDDKLYTDYLAKFIPPVNASGESNLPAVLITEPIDKNTKAGRNRWGATMFYAPATHLKSNPDKLACDIMTQIKKYAPGPEADRFRHKEYESLDPFAGRADYEIEDQREKTKRRNKRRGILRYRSVSTQGMDGTIKTQLVSPMVADLDDLCEVSYLMDQEVEVEFKQREGTSYGPLHLPPVLPEQDFGGFDKTTIAIACGLLCILFFVFAFMIAGVVIVSRK